MFQVACNRCNGSGWLTCPDCKGKGIRFQLGRAPRGDLCVKCMGKGVLGKCSQCNGTGKTEGLETTECTDPYPPAIMERAYDFSEDQIRYNVEKRSIGNYLLGYSATHKETNSEVFHVTLVGRSDTDLQEELLMRLAKKKPWYAQFKFTYVSTAREAFERECREFHSAIGTIDNKAHPEPPKGTTLPCPVPNCNALET